jgi:hypothetical protein
MKARYELAKPTQPDSRKKARSDCTARPGAHKVTYAAAILGKPVKGDHHTDQRFSLTDTASSKSEDIGDPAGYTGSISTYY